MKVICVEASTGVNFTKGRDYEFVDGCIIDDDEYNHGHIHPINNIHEFLILNGRFAARFIPYRPNNNKIRYDKISTTVKTSFFMPKIKKVIFNDPATIVFWGDDTKTVVKCTEGDEFNPEFGLAMAISKKALGNDGNYYNEFSKWLPKNEKIDVNKCCRNCKYFESTYKDCSKRNCFRAFASRESGQHIDAWEQNEEDK